MGYHEDMGNNPYQRRKSSKKYDSQSRAIPSRVMRRCLQNNKGSLRLNPVYIYRRANLGRDRALSINSIK